MRVTMHGFFLVLFSILQATWINSIEILNITPNLFLIYIIVICCFCSRVEGGTVGFAFGFVLDLLVGKIWGLYALLGLICGFFISHFCEKVLRNNNIIIVFLFVFFGTLVYEILYYLISLLFVDNMNFVTALFRVALPESVYNLIISAPLYFVINKFAKRLYVDKGEIIG